MIKKILAKTYRFIVGDNRAVIYFYTLSKYKHQKIYRFCPFLLWIYLLWLVVKYRIFRINPCGKMPGDEMMIRRYPKKSVLLKNIENADIISFDVFDTLILRRLSDSRDVFILVGNTLKIKNYKNKRIFAEQMARKEAHGGEVILEDICKLVEKMYGIDASSTYIAELQTELRACIANPYFVDLMQSGVLKGKKVIAVSDMYLPASFIRYLLEVCGFKIDEIFVSSEYGCSKADGGLWQIVKDKFRGEKIVHIGDDCIADMKMCGRAGIDFVGVSNLNKELIPCKNIAVNSVVMSLYTAQVNKLFATGMDKFSTHYEFGYVYGGILTYGFCQWLNKLAKEKTYELLLFTARDSKVFFNMYQKFFGEVRAEYLYISRFAALKLALEKNFEMYLDIMFCAKVNLKNKITVGQALAEAEIGFLADELPTYGLNTDSTLDEKNINALTLYLSQSKNRILEAYRGDMEVFGQYITPIIGDAKKICVIDLGWRGTVYSMLDDYLSERYYDIQLYGAMVGASDNSFTNMMLEEDRLFSYAFSYAHNIDLMVDKKKIALLELMFSNASPSVTGYAFDESGNPSPVFGKPEGNDECYFDDIHRGIYDFCEDYYSSVKRLMFTTYVSGADAVGPVMRVSRNKKYISNLFWGLKMSLEANSSSERIINYIKK